MTRTSVGPLLLLWACADVPVGPTDTGSGPGLELLEDAPEVEERPTYEGDFFDDTVIHSVDITLSRSAESDLRRDPYEFVPAEVVIDGWPFPAVGLRLRGKIGSFRTLSGKPKFKLDFNAFVEGGRFGPYKSLALNNEVVDCSFLREPTGYALFRQVGLPAPRTAYTQVTVNGDDYGLYVALEFPDDVFLASHYADGGGNLYDGKYVYYSDGSYGLADFSADLVGNFRIEEGTEVGGADVQAIADATLTAGTWAERLDPLVDSEAFHRHLAAEQWVGQLDGYGLNRNNYRVYFDPSDGRADLLTYDLDYAFYPNGSWGVGWAAPVGTLAQACWADAACLAAQREAGIALAEEVDTAALLADVDRWTALIGAAAEADPRRECAASSVAPDQAGMRAWVASGSDVLRTFWAE